MKPKNLTNILAEFDKGKWIDDDWISNETTDNLKDFIRQSLTELLEESIIEEKLCLDMEEEEWLKKYKAIWNSARQEQIKKIKELKL